MLEKKSLAEEKKSTGRQDKEFNSKDLSSI